MLTNTTLQIFMAAKNNVIAISFFEEARTVTCNDTDERQSQEAVTARPLSPQLQCRTRCLALLYDKP
jgi:hypothetical protein